MNNKIKTNSHANKSIKSFYKILVGITTLQAKIKIALNYKITSIKLRSKIMRRVKF